MNAAADGPLRLFTVGNVLAGLMLSFALSFLLSRLRAPRYPKDIPWVGDGKGPFSAIKSMKDWIQKGYQDYSKQDKFFIVPGLLGTPPEVVVPRSQMAWMLDQPDHVISVAAAHYDIMNGDYSFVDRAILADPYHEHVVHRTLTRHLTALVPQIDEQVRLSVDDIFGTDHTAWKTLNIWDALMEFVPRVTHRILVGRPLCENRDYLDGMINFSVAVTRDLLLFPLLPTIIKPFVCPLFGLSTKFAYWKTAKHSVPLIKQRLAAMAAKERGDPAYEDWQAPNDYITWHITTAKAEGRTHELDPHRIAQRIMPINFGSIHTTVLTGLNMFLDILSHDSEQHILASLRDEVARVRQEQGPGPWTKAGLAKLHRLDSAVRESMRWSTFTQTMVLRKVVAPGGVTHKASGQHFARGTLLSCPIWGTQHDDDLFGGAAAGDRFDAFRYSRAREAYEARGDEDKKPEEGLKVAKMGMVTTSSEHFAFGHGRHAWWAALLFYFFNPPPPSLLPSCAWLIWSEYPIQPRSLFRGPRIEGHDGLFVDELRYQAIGRAAAVQLGRQDHGPADCCDRGD